jgi:hypothetical protein
MLDEQPESVIERELVKLRLLQLDRIRFGHRRQSQFT